MPPHLHPRSRTTASLFTATLLTSILVVSLPHVFPCPAPRLSYADADDGPPSDPENPRPRRKRRRKVAPCEKSEGRAVGEDAADDTGGEGMPPRQGAREVATFYPEGRQRRKAHECPVPKAKAWEGLVDRWKGWGGGEGKG